MKLRIDSLQSRIVLFHLAAIVLTAIIFALANYLVISRANHEAGLRQGVMYAASRGMLLDRVFSIRRANIFEPHRYRHVVGPIRLKDARNGVAVVHTHFLCARIMHDGVTTLFASGRYLDRIDVTATPFRFKERIVVLDSDKIDTLLAIPL